VRHDAEHFGDRDLDLIYIAKRLKEALRLEDLLTQSGIDYMVETDTYRGGVIFVTERTGVFFYIDPASVESARQFMEPEGFKVWRED